MCRSCYEEDGAPAIVNDKTRRMADLLTALDDFTTYGGNLHVVTDDWNLDDESIAWCRDEAIVKNLANADAEQLAVERACLDGLIACTEEERLSAMALREGYIAVAE